MPRKSSKKAKAAQRKRSLTARRILALLLFLAALALGAVAYLSNPRYSMYVWAAAAVCMLIEAALLFKKRAMPVLIYILLGVLCAALIFTAPAYVKYIPLFERNDFTPVDITELTLKTDPTENFQYLQNLRKLDLRGSDITDFEPFKACATLEEIDVRDNHAFTQETRDEFAAALPNCKVRWSMPIAGRYYDDDTTEIDLSDQQLSPDEITSLIRENPQIDFHYALDVYGQRADMHATELNLQNTPNVDADELYRNLRMLPEVTKVDLRGTPTPIETVRALQDQHPQIEFLFDFAVPGGKLSTLDTEFAFTPEMTGSFADYEPYFEYMPNLKKIDLRGAPLSEEEINRIREDYPDQEVNFAFLMFGQYVTNTDTKVVLDKIKIPSTEAVEYYLQYLPNLQQLDMCDCGISDEEMAAMRDRHPEIKIVWRVHFAGGYTLRTDAEVFSTCYHCSWSFSSASFAPLQYCTDMLFLDLGHDHVSDIRLVTKMPKLKVLILACNTITDISPLAELKDLEFLELFSNYITDFSPLAGMTKLLDLNINRNKVKSIQPFLTLTSLQRLWIGACGLSNSELKQIQAALPNCKINTSAGNNPTSAGWREHPHYFTIKKMYEVKYYIPWDVDITKL